MKLRKTELEKKCAVKSCMREKSSTTCRVQVKLSIGFMPEYKWLQNVSRESSLF